MAKIRPALTPEEWKREVPTSLHDPDTAIQFAVGYVALSGEWPLDRMRSAMIALLNNSLPDNDPRKITRADVLGLRHRGVGYEDNDDFLLELAAKLAALLPPEDR